MKPLLVGELNPYGADPYFALYHLPREASGNRLRLILGLEDNEYLDKFDRVNLSEGRWSLRTARLRANAILGGEPRSALVLLGAKVCSAFSLPFWPFTVQRSACAWDEGGVPVAVLPHPSGLSRLWNVEGADERARSACREAGAL